PPAPGPSPAEETASPPRRKRRRLVMMVMLLALVGGGAWLILDASTKRPVGNEMELAQKARKVYEEGEFAEAAQQFRDLTLNFPKSADVTKYAFLAELSDVRGPVSIVQPDKEEAKRNLERLFRFAEDYKGDPLLEKHLPELQGDFKRL